MDNFLVNLKLLAWKPFKYIFSFFPVPRKAEVAIALIYYIYNCEQLLGHDEALALL